MTRRTAAAAIAIGLVALLGIGVPVMVPADADAYRETATTAAEDALSAVRSTALALDAEPFGPYLTVVVDDAREAAASALRELASEEAPDDASRALRDELSPLLADAVAAIDDRSSGQLTVVGDRLRDFVEANRQ